MCKDKSFSIQIVAQGGERNQIQVPLFGKHHCRLVSVSLDSVEALTANKLVRLNSPQFRLKYSSAVSYQPGGSLRSSLSSQPFPVFSTAPDAQITGFNGSVEWEADFQGYIDLQVESLQWPIDDLDTCVITINLTPSE